MATPRAGKSLGIGLLPPLDEHEGEGEEADKDVYDHDVEVGDGPSSDTATAAQSPVSTAYSLGAGSLHRNQHEHVSTTIPSMSNQSGKQKRRRAESTNTLYDDQDDADAQSVQSEGSARSIVSATSVSSGRSLGAGSILPLIEEEADGADNAEESPNNCNANQHTPTLSNKGKHPIGHPAGAINVEPLLGINISQHSSSNDDLSALHAQHNDDAISVLSGHSTSLPLPLASDDACFFSHRSGGLEPMRQGRDDAPQEANDTSTLVSGITFDDAGGESAMRRRSHQQSQRQHGASFGADENNASQISGKSKKKMKMKSPFKRKKKNNTKGDHGENDSASVISGFSWVSDLASSVVSGRSNKSRMSLLTIGSTRSRMSSLTGKLRKRGKKKEKGTKTDGNVVGNEDRPNPSVPQSTPAKIAFDNRSAISSLASSAAGSYPATPVRGSQKESSYSPLKYGESAVNTTLPTVESGDEDSSAGDREGSTLGSIISALSVGSMDISKPSERIKQKNRAYQLKKTGRKSKKDGAAGSSVSDSSSVGFALTSRAPPSEESSESVSTGKKFRRKKSPRKMNPNIASVSDDSPSESQIKMRLGDFLVPDGLADRAPAEEIMLRLGVSSEIGLAALKELRNLPHISMLDNRSSLIPTTYVCGVEIPDYDSYVQNSVDRFRQRLVI